MAVNLNSEPATPPRVVLLGGSGFIGRQIASVLDANGVTVLSLGSQHLNLSEPHAVKRLQQELRSTDSVVLLSAITPDKGRSPDSFITNLLMLKHICEALQKVNVNHFVYFSSDSVYGRVQSYLSEDSALAPQDLYGVMHLSREFMLSELRDIPIVVLRVTMVYGAGDTHGSYGPNRFFREALQNNRIVIFGCGSELRDHIHVNDVAAITVQCINMRTTGLLNIATGKSSTFKEVATMVSAQFSTKIELVEHPRAVQITHRHFDITNLIKWNPTLSFINIEDGIKSYQQD